MERISFGSCFASHGHLISLAYGSFFYLQRPSLPSASVLTFTARSQELHYGLPHQMKGPSTCSIIFCIPGCISRTLDWKKKYQDMNWYCSVKGNILSSNLQPLHSYKAIFYYIYISHPWLVKKIGLLFNIITLITSAKFPVTFKITSWGDGTQYSSYYSDFLQGI